MLTGPYRLVLDPLYLVGGRRSFRLRRAFPLFGRAPPSASIRRVAVLMFADAKMLAFGRLPAARDRSGRWRCIFARVRAMRSGWWATIAAESDAGPRMRRGEIEWQRVTPRVRRASEATPPGEPQECQRANFRSSISTGLRPSHGADPFAGIEKRFAWRCVRPQGELLRTIC